MKKLFTLTVLMVLVIGGYAQEVHFDFSITKLVAEKRIPAFRVADLDDFPARVRQALPHLLRAAVNDTGA